MERVTMVQGRRRRSAEGRESEKDEARMRKMKRKERRRRGISGEGIVRSNREIRRMDTHTPNLGGMC